MKTLIRILMLLIWTIGCAALVYLYVSITKEGEAEQMLEEKYVLEYLNLQAVEEEPSAEQPETEETEPLDPSDYEYSFDYSDDNWYSRNGETLTPDLATGEIFGILEIPSIELRRAVYTGTWADIRHNLDIWMVTMARPDYEMGKTHLCIYGHNTTTQNLSFNNLRYVHIGDCFIITKDKHVYVYEATRFFPEWRSNATKKYVDNMSIDPSLCYIITCGRDEYACRDVLLEGTLKRTFTVKEWETMEASEWLAANYRTYKYAEEEKEVGIVEERERVELTAEGKSNELTVYVKTEDGSDIYTTVGIYGTDGYEVASPLQITGESAKIALSDGEYVLGIDDDRYASNAIQIKIRKDYDVKTEVIKKQTFLEDIPKELIYAGIGLLYTVGVILILLATLNRKAKEN